MAASLRAGQSRPIDLAADASRAVSSARFSARRRRQSGASSGVASRRELRRRLVSDATLIGAATVCNNGPATRREPLVIAPNECCQACLSSTLLCARQCRPAMMGEPSFGRPMQECLRRPSFGRTHAICRRRRFGARVNRCSCPFPVTRRLTRLWQPSC